MPETGGVDWRFSFTQATSGTVTLVPATTIWHYIHLIDNPTKEFLAEYFRRGACAAWPKICRLSNHYIFERTLEQCGENLRQQAKTRRRANRRTSGPSRDAASSSMGSASTDSAEKPASDVPSFAAAPSPYVPSGMMRRHSYRDMRTWWQQDESTDDECDTSFVEDSFFHEKDERFFRLSDEEDGDEDDARSFSDSDGLDILTPTQRKGEGTYSGSSGGEATLPELEEEEEEEEEGGPDEGETEQTEVAVLEDHRLRSRARAVERKEGTTEGSAEELVVKVTPPSPRKRESSDVAMS